MQFYAVKNKYAIRFNKELLFYISDSIRKYSLFIFTILILLNILLLLLINNKKDALEWLALYSSNPSRILSLEPQRHPSQYL